METCKTCACWQPNQEAVEQREDAKYECRHPEVWIRTRIEFGCTLHTPAHATAVNVPHHTKNGTMTDPNPRPLDGPTEILIITYHKDFEWLVYCLRCVRKYCTGFQGVTVAHPNRDAEQFKTLLDQFDVRLHGYDEVDGKGMLQHMVKMASGDEFLPAGTKYMLTLDADCMFHTPSTPEHFAWNDKPYWIVRTWDSLTTEDPRNPGSKVVSDCMMWEPVTREQLGFAPKMYTMCVNSQMIPLDLLRSYREHLARHHGRSFEKYMLMGRNEWPQSRTDFNSMGAFFWEHARDRFHWFDVMQPPFPADRKKAYWSHGGLLPEHKAEIESFLR